MMISKQSISNGVAYEVKSTVPYNGAVTQYLRAQKSLSQHDPSPSYQNGTSLQVSFVSGNGYLTVTLQDAMSY